MGKKKNEARAKAAQGASDVEDDLAALQDEVMQNLEDAGGYLKRQLEERPIAVAAAALGVGLLVGLLIGRRR